MTSIRLSLQSIPLRRGIALLALVFGFALSALLGYELYRDRAATIEAGRATTQNLARLLEEHARQSLRRIELLSLQAAQEIDAAGGPARADPAALRQRLRARLPTDGLIRAFVLIGPTGAGMLSTLDHVERHLPGLAERDFFSAQRERADLGIVFGAPVKSAVDGKWLLPVSVRLAAPASVFQGVLVALVDPATIQGFYASIDTGKNGFVTLFLREGWIAARVPFDARVMRRNWNDSPLFTQHLPRAPSDTVRQIVAADGVERLYSYRALKEYPVIVTVGVSLTDALAGWRERAWHTGLLLLLALAVVSGALMALLRQIKRRETAERQLRRTSTIVDLTSDLIATARIDGGLVYLNAAARRAASIGLDEDITRYQSQQFMSAEQWSFTLQVARPAAVKDGVWSGENHLHAPEGREIPVSQVVIAHRDARGKVEFLPVFHATSPSANKSKPRSARRRSGSKSPWTARRSACGKPICAAARSGWIHPGRRILAIRRGQRAPPPRNCCYWCIRRIDRALPQRRPGA